MFEETFSKRDRSGAAALIIHNSSSQISPFTSSITTKMEAHFRICFLFVIFEFFNVNAQVCDISALSLDPMLLIDGATPEGPYTLLYTPIFFTCTSTYMSNQPEYNMCQGFDIWITSPEDYTCSAPCSADEWSSFTATVTSGQYFTTDNAYEHNTVISLSCAEGSIEGSDIITCQDGSWIPSRQSIRCNLCGTTGLSLAPMLLIDDVIPAPSYPVFDLISVTCQTSYMSTFGNFNLCLESGWITPLQDYECLAPCAAGTLSSVDVSVINGQYFASDDVYEHNTILEFSCSAGTLEGPAFTACQNGAWSPATDSVQCKQPCDSPEFAEPIGTYYHGDAVDFTCLYSSDTLPPTTCLDGVWAPAITCSDPQQLTTTDGNSTDNA